MKQYGNLIVVNVLIPIVTIIFYSVVDANLELNIVRLTVQIVIRCVNYQLRVGCGGNPGLS